MKILHLTTLFPVANNSYKGFGCRAHAVRNIVEHLQDEREISSQAVLLYYPFLAPYYGYFSEEKKGNKQLLNAPWMQNLSYHREFALPNGRLSQYLSPLWQKLVSIRHISAMEFDVIHLHTPLQLGILAQRVRAATGKPLVVTVRREGNIHAWASLEKGLRLTTQGLFRDADHLVSPSIESANHIGALTDQSVQIIPNGTSPFFDEPFVGSNRSSNTILFVGALDQNKGILLLIEKFQELLEEDPSLELIIIGDGPLKSKIECDCKKYQQIKIYGRLEVSKVRAFMRTATILCVPSYSETFGVVYAEAMKQGLPVIGRSGTGIDGYGVRGVHYELLDTDSDLLSLLRNLLQNSERRQELARNAAEIAKNWTWVACARKHAEVYRMVLYA